MPSKTESIKCRACQGKGYLANLREYVCKKCLGSGTILVEVEEERKISFTFVVVCVIISIVSLSLWMFL
jgi:DnaJ-class molecular chaperone